MLETSISFKCLCQDVREVVEITTSRIRRIDNDGIRSAEIQIKQTVAFLVYLQRCVHFSATHNEMYIKAPDDEKASS
jgi:hypothetical protein